MNEENKNNGFEFPNSGIKVDSSEFNTENNNLKFETAHSNDPISKANEEAITEIDMSLVENEINDNNKELREHSTFKVPTDTFQTQPKVNIDFPHTTIREEDAAKEREQLKQDLKEQKSFLQRIKDLFKKKPGSR